MKNISILCLMSLVIIIFASCSSEYKNIQTELPSLINKPDGVYRGEYDLSGTPIKVTLDVTIQNNAITLINLVEHKCSPIGKKAEKITIRIIEQQSLNVDVIAGATASSKSILKAVEKALQ
jgi:uncharacterized protein with FMN-binding domain